MKAIDFVSQLRAKVSARSDIVMEHFPLRYARSDERYEFLRVTSDNFRTAFRPSKWLLITAGFHGNEKAGPFTILRRFDELIEVAHSRGIGLVMYPLINPSGFDADQRYGLDGRKEFGNNDFCHYMLPDGKVVDDLGDKRQEMVFKHWFSAKQDCLDRRPIETIRLHACIDNDKREYGLFAGSIDLHQDRFLTGPAGYYYALGHNIPLYSDIVKKVEAVIGCIFRNTVVDSGESSPAESDENGCVVRHDGSISDYLHRRGVPHTIVAKTTGDTPMEKAIEVNMLWIRSIINLIARGH